MLFGISCSHKDSNNIRGFSLLYICLSHEFSGLNVWLRQYTLNAHVAAKRHGLEPGMRVLELGPAGGYFTPAACRAVAPDGQLIALDLQMSLLKRLRRRLGAGTPPLVCGNALSLPFRPASFDLVFLVEVLGEIPDKAAMLREITGILRPGGTLAISETMLVDPDYIPAAATNQMATQAGFLPINRVDDWFQYTQRFTRA